MRCNYVHLFLSNHNPSRNRQIISEFHKIVTYINLYCAAGIQMMLSSMKMQLLGVAHPAISRTRETSHNTYWCVLYLDFTAALPGRFLPSSHPYRGRGNKTKPRKNPVRNPPMWAKLSTCGRIPIARLIAMMTKRVSKAAAYKTTSSKGVSMKNYASTQITYNNQPTSQELAIIVVKAKKNMQKNSWLHSPCWYRDSS